MNNQTSLQLPAIVPFAAFTKHVNLSSGKHTLCAPPLALRVPSFSSAPILLYLTATWTGFHPALSMALKSSRFATGMTTSHAFPKTQMITIFAYVSWQRKCSSMCRFQCLKPCDMWALTLFSTIYVHTLTYFSIVFLECVWALNVRSVHLVRLPCRQAPLSVRYRYAMKKSCKFDMSKINPRIDIVLAQNIHSIEVIQLCSEVNKGEIVPASLK